MILVKLKKLKSTKGYINKKVNIPTSIDLMIAAKQYTRMISFILNGGINKSTIFPATFEDSKDEEKAAGQDEEEDERHNTAQQSSGNDGQGKAHSDPLFCDTRRQDGPAHDNPRISP